MSKRNTKSSKRRDRLRIRAIAAKERYKALAGAGSILIGGLVGFDEYAHGMGGTFSAFAGVVTMAITGAAFGALALGIKVDEKYHRR